GGWVGQVLPDPSSVAGASPLFAATGITGAGRTAGGVYRFSTGTSTWAPASKGIPNGAVITSLAANSNGALLLAVYAATDGNGVYGSINNGLTWAQVGTGLSSVSVSALLFDTVGDLYAGASAASGGGIFKLALSTQATAWTQMTSGTTPTVQAFAQDAATGTIWAQLAAGTSSGGGLFKLTAGTWAPDTAQPLLASLPATDCTLTRANASALAVDFSGGVIYWGSESCRLVVPP